MHVYNFHYKNLSIKINSSDVYAMAFELCQLYSRIRIKPLHTDVYNNKINTLLDLIVILKPTWTLAVEVINHILIVTVILDPWMWHGAVFMHVCYL